MSKYDWDPHLYLKFGRERIQPTIDLISRIRIEYPAHIIDIGCGPGNSTQILWQRWPDSKIVGVDKSPAMLEQARNTLPHMQYKLLDAGQDNIPGVYDLVFSNATIQWIPDHVGLLEKFNALLSKNGILAIQLPLFFEMPLGQCIANLSRQNRWTEFTAGVNDLFTIHTRAEYYEMLSALFGSIEIWETEYVHIMESHESILQMIKSTRLKPYLEKLHSDQDKVEFSATVLEGIKRDYPIQKNGKVLFPFKRLFFIAEK